MFNLEPTFRCNLECPMCPRFSSEDPHLDMSPETYARIHEVMGYAHTVDFTGWGEPLLHRSIYQMIRMAVDHGCSATMTSNGTALTEKNARQLCDSGLSNLVVSVDGMRPETYDPIRIGSSFEQLTLKLKGLSAVIEKGGYPLKFGIAFTVQRNNASDLERIIPWMQSVGARVLHLKQLNVISAQQDWSSSYLNCVHSPVSGDEEELRALEDRMREVVSGCRKVGLEVMVHSEMPMNRDLSPRNCLAAPLHAVYFSYEGRVSPCCHFGHHVSRFFEGQFYPPSALFYGDIRIQTLEEIWESVDYRKFRDGFSSQSYPEPCQSCYLLYGK